MPRSELTAAPPDSGGDQGVHTQPQDALTVTPLDAEDALAPPLHTDPTHGGDPGSPLSLFVVLSLLILAMAAAWIGAHLL